MTLEQLGQEYTMDLSKEPPEAAEKRCKTCAHWGRKDFKYNSSLAGARECGNVPQLWDVTDPDPAPDDYGQRKLKQEFAAVVLVTIDSGGNSLPPASMYTMPDFGCVRHEEATA